MHYKIKLFQQEGDQLGKNFKKAEKGTLS